MQIDYSKRIFGLDIMRAAAILMVVLSHALWLKPNAQGFVPDILRLAGVMGVEIFFVLSGFLIGRIVYRIFKDDGFSFNKLKYFWVRRWFRTLPNYYLVLILNILLAIILGNQLPENLWHYFLFLQNFAWKIPLFFTESWSLPVEEFAYILGPLLLYLVLFFKLKIDKSKLFFWITILVIICFTITKIAYNYNIENTNMQLWNVNLKAVTIYRIDAIYYGMLAAYLSIVKPKSWQQLRLLWFILGLSIFLGLNYLIPKLQLTIENQPFFWNVLYLPINSIAIAFGLPLLSNIKSAPSFILKPITFISIISYSMYLLHYSIILQLVKKYVPSGALQSSEMLMYSSIYVITTVVLAYMLYCTFEKPMMDLRDKEIIRKQFN